METYNNFINTKNKFVENIGFNIDINSINNFLKDWQKYIVAWAVRKGKAGLFEDCGLGKTCQQIEWLKIIMDLTREDDGIGLVICPLSVAEQTISEAEKLGYKLKFVKNENECESLGRPIFITNYEQLHNFETIKIKAMVLDESSILKSIDGKIKDRLVKMSTNIKYKLSCTATPSPNDISELGNQVEFIGICSRKEMLSKFFVNDAQSGCWRLKGHAVKDFYKWMASWSIFIRKPSDIGFSDDGFILPELKIKPLWIDSEYIPDGELLPVSSVKGLKGRLDVRRKTMDDKINKSIEMIKKSTEQWLIFCKLNSESQMYVKADPNCVEVTGADTPEKKNESFWKFKRGEIKNLCTKPKIGGFGMNFQNSNNMLFIGLGDSFEEYYQCIRRQYRFGQKNNVNVWIALTNAEQVILNNVIDKEQETKKLYDNVIKEMHDFTIQEIKGGIEKLEDVHEVKVVEKKGFYKAIKGDSCETIKMIESDSVDMQIFSPPFFSLYTYSPSPRDIGNNKDDAEFWSHFDFLIPELLRVLKPGRVCAVHCMDVPSTLVNDGFIGTKDLRGDIIREFTRHGYIWDGCAVIPKNPQAQSIRTHSKGLTFTQFEKDSAWSRPALPDYLLKFRKPGENKIFIENGNGKEISRDDWIDLAAGVWRIKPEMEIQQEEFELLLSGIWDNVNETNTLNTRKYKGDEKHMCPLQLDTIHNAIRLWSNPGETIHSPFGGVGSEGYQSIKDGRKIIIQELKSEYFDQLVKNLDTAIEKKTHGFLFDEEELSSLESAI